jgi:hypothetical protein
VEIVPNRRIVQAWRAAPRIGTRDYTLSLASSSRVSNGPH